MIIDAKDKTLGRLASKIARILQGKHKPSFRPEKVGDEMVEVENIDQMKVTKRKLQDKIYYRYSGYPGGLKKITLGELLEKNPGEVLKKAISGMLPKNRLRKQRIKRLKIK
ncbi:MAG: 50S ribosomal protein L13 [Candidatus Bathyarchaeota archaeon]|nr:50S ribosomal protein L13 [Candidatus Bathyarchaeota archaeon]